MPEEGRPISSLVGRTEEEPRVALMTRVILIGAIFATIAIGSYLVLYVQVRAWQILLDVLGLVLGMICLLPAYWSVRRRSFDVAGYWIVLALVVVYGAGELVWADATLSNLISVLLLFLLVGSVLRPRRWPIWFAVAGLYLIHVLLVNLFEPLPRYPIMASAPATQYINVPLALAVLWQVARALHISTIRARLLISFLLLVVLPAVAISVGATVVGLRNGQQQAVDQLETVATFTERAISSWVEGMQADLLVVLGEEGTGATPVIGVAGTGEGQAITYARALLLASPDELYYGTYKSTLRPFLQRVLQPTRGFAEIFVMNLEGEVILSTDVAHEGRALADRSYFEEGLAGFYVQPPSDDPAMGDVSVVAVHPIVSVDGEVLGVLAGRAGMAALEEILGQRAGLGQSGKIYLVDRDYTLLTALEEQPVYVYTFGAVQALESWEDGSGLYEDYRSVFVVGAYRWLPELQVALLAEQDQSEAFSAVYATLGVVMGVAVAAVVVAVIAGLRVTRGIATPLADLATTATQIASGDLERAAEVGREDEIGALAQAFNSMTVQLRGLIGSLEQRVAERTRYLEAAAGVGRAAASILDMGQLIRQVVELIRERFELYYVGLFLMDEAGEWAVLRAGTGEAGRVMLERGHRIRVGEGMIGWSVEHSQARIALDVGEDAVRLATDELPETRSEAALPLRSRGRVLGALTVQSERPAAFDEAAIAVLQTMADQVAVALDNARLFAEGEEALEEVRRAYGEVTGEAWRELLVARPGLGYRSDEHEVTGAEDVWRPEMEQALQKGQIVRGDGADTGAGRSLAVPIKVRGDTVGVLDTYKPDEAGDWTPEEVSLLEALAEQLGVALDSARLYQATQSRAIRERLIAEIAARMRETLDMDTVLRTAVLEIGERLGIAEVEVRMGGLEGVSGGPDRRE